LLRQFNGKWYTEAVINDISFKDKFINRYPETRFNIRTAPFGYDMFNIIVAGTQDEGGLLNYIGGLGKYSGVVGNMSKDANNNYIKAIPGVWNIVDGKAILVK